MFWRNSIIFCAFVLTVCACGRTQGPHYDSALARYDLDGATWHVVFPRLEQVRDDFLTLVVNMEGMEGLLALIEGATRVDLADEDLFAQAGLDKDFRPLLFEHRGVPMLCLGVTSSDRFLDYAAEIATARGQSLEQIITDGPAVHRLGTSAALAVHGNLALLALDGQVDPTAALASLLLTEPPQETPVFEEGLYHLSYVPGPGTRLEERVREHFADLGVAAGLVRSLVRYFDDCDSFTGTVSPGDRYVVSGKMLGCAIPFASSGHLAPEMRLPHDTVLLLHTIFDGETLWDLFPPSLQLMLRWAFKGLPKEVPESLAGPDKLLSRFHPEVALAFLGLSLDASLETFTGRKGAQEPIFGAHLVLMLALREGQVVDDLFDEKVGAELLPKFEARGIGAGKISGTEFCRKEKKKKGEVEKRCFAMLRHEERFFLVTGLGEGERLVRTLQGQQETLGSTLFAQQKSGPLTITLKTRRLVRDLVSKGFPPYFLQVLASVLEVHLVADRDGDNTRIDLEVVMR